MIRKNMIKLTEEAVRNFITKRYPAAQILAVEMFDNADMAFVLTMFNTSTVTRYTVDINSDGDIDIWSCEVVRFVEIYKRSEI